MGQPERPLANEPKMAHVNLMIDTVIANLPAEGLRSVLRSMLAADPSITPLLENRTRNYLQKSLSSRTNELFADGLLTEHFGTTQQRVRSMLGCGMCYESVALLTRIVDQASDLRPEFGLSEDLLQALGTVDGDIVQAITAVQKTLLMSKGSRPLTQAEKAFVQSLLDAVVRCSKNWSVGAEEFVFERSLIALRNPSMGLHDCYEDQEGVSRSLQKLSIAPVSASVEMFQLNDRPLPRLFSGLWQLSSPSWGTASTQKIRKQFESYANKGFTAYDMADHYGDAEVMFGKFRSSCANPDAIFGATKYCIFTPTSITREVVKANITERCQRMASDHIDLLQFHWQFYDDPQYIQALKYLQEDTRINMLGLCNFDTQRMLEIVQAGIEIHTNQVQFSLIDSRPTFGMGAACVEHDVKLLTYGTLCGGFLAEKWLGQGEPELFLDNITPSQRKYYEMILNWGGWALFQELLQILKMIAIKHGVSISNVATRWVLDFPFVGAVIIGTRMGVSEHAEENMKTFGWRLDESDQEAIQTVFKKSKRDQLMAVLGDCGGEYR